jgi:coproporphyrinogen III oxidase
MEIYVHAAGKEIALTELSEDTTAAALVATQLGGDGHAWLEDAEQPLERDVALKAAGVGNRAHVHVSKCPAVHVTVRYPGADTIEQDFKPNQTIARVFEWATGKSGFNLTPTEKAKHALGICDTTTEADKDEHVGTFAGDECKACFDLAPKERFEG